MWLGADDTQDSVFYRVGQIGGDDLYASAFKQVKHLQERSLSVFNEDGELIDGHGSWFYLFYG